MQSTKKYIDSLVLLLLLDGWFAFYTLFEFMCANMFCVLLSYYHVHNEGKKSSLQFGKCIIECYWAAQFTMLSIRYVNTFTCNHKTHRRPSMFKCSLLCVAEAHYTCFFYFFMHFVSFFNFFHFSLLCTFFLSFCCCCFCCCQCAAEVNTGTHIN